MDQYELYQLISNHHGAVERRRERIATAAMQGLLSNPDIDDLDAGMIASDAVLHADALIARLDARPKEAQ